MKLGKTCPLTGSDAVEDLFSLGEVPVLCNQLWETEAEATKAPAGEIDLVFGTESGLIWNAAFDPDKMVYAQGYENALHFSPKFQAFAEDLAAGLIRRFDLAGKDVVEIGCGDGHMLNLMVKHGARTGTGFDPSMEGRPSEFAELEGVEIVPEYFRSDQLDRPMDAILCRHVLEHVDTPLPFLQDIRKAIGDRDIPIYFEVPNAEWILSAVSMWDVIYEHVTYWTRPAMQTLMGRAGFRITSLSAGYGDQFLMVEARPAPAPVEDIEPIERVHNSATIFAESTRQELQTWQYELSKNPGRTVVWGAGSKGITFANVLEKSAADSLIAMVDLNPRKHGLWTPGKAVPVISPSDLPGMTPDRVLVSNALYEDEIKKDVQNLGINPKISIIAG